MNGYYLDEDERLTPHEGTANNSCFQYEPGSPAANSELADSFVSCGKMRAKRSKQREIIQDKHDKDQRMAAGGPNRFCRQCCNGELVPDYCSIF